MRWKYTQADGERKRYTVDYSDWLDTGELIASVTYAITQNTTGSASPALTVTGSQILPGSTGVQFYVSGGVDGEEYSVIMTMTTNTNTPQIKEDSVIFQIENPE